MSTKNLSLKATLGKASSLKGDVLGAERYLSMKPVGLPALQQSKDGPFQLGLDES